MARVDKVPNSIITDKGGQFIGAGFHAWCKRKQLGHRFGALGEIGSIAIVERLILTLKNECTRRIFVRLDKRSFRNELLFFTDWYNSHRPHSTLKATTPDEVYHGQPAEAQAIDIKPDRAVLLHVNFLHGRKHLPVISLTRAA
jgi:transposase InsO family protein